MIYKYSISQTGTDHIKHGIVNQDYVKTKVINDSVAVAIVADGLGSAELSDIGSRLAVEYSMKSIEMSLNNSITDFNMLDYIRTAFIAAYKAVELESENNDNSIELYDTTLTMAVLINSTLFYGHSGDGGIIALTTKGTYEQVTNQQRDTMGRVFPLFFTDKWEFGEYEKKVCAVLLATDGMLEPFFPIYLKDEEVKIHVSLAEFFMDNGIDEYGEEETTARIGDYISKISSVSDDKTIAVLINTKIKPDEQPDEYYKEPDWKKLKAEHSKKWRKLAYPGLFGDST